MSNWLSQLTILFCLLSPKDFSNKTYLFSKGQKRNNQTETVDNSIDVLKLVTQNGYKNYSFLTLVTLDFGWPKEQDTF